MTVINKFIVLLALTITFAPLSHSANNMVTDAELALLPQYCAARMGGNNTQAYKNWSQRFGQKNFVHMHHYCIGLNSMNRASMEFDPKKKRFILQQARRNFEYVLRNWPRDFSLTPMAEMYRQQAEMMLGMTR